MPPRCPPWKTSNSQPTTASYLADLRNNRPTRPGGARPPPTKSASYAPSHSYSRSESIADDEQRGGSINSSIDRRSSVGHFDPESYSSRYFVQPSSHLAPSVRGRKVSPTAVIQSVPQDDGVYLKSDLRLSERKESHFLREALDKVDHKDEERRLHQAAQDEASQLVWQHQNPTLAEEEKARPYENPDLQQIPRQQSVPKSKVSIETVTTGEAKSLFKRAARRISSGHSRRRSSANRIPSNGSSKGVFRNPVDEIYEEPEAIETSVSTETPQQRPAALKTRSRNSLPRQARPMLPPKSDTAPLPVKQQIDRFEIHRNLPSQSRNGFYTVNPPTPPPANDKTTAAQSSGDIVEIRSDDIRAATSRSSRERSPNLPTPVAVSDHIGRPIVSFDRSWKPADNVSKYETRALPSRPPLAVPAMTISAPEVPTVQLSSEENDDVPTIAVDDFDLPSPPTQQPKLPTISLPDDQQLPREGSRSRPPPSVDTVSMTHSNQSISRPLPTHTHSLPVVPSQPNSKPTSRLPWLNQRTNTRNNLTTPTATCAACYLPISGRILTASRSSPQDQSTTPTNNLATTKSLFHPACFTCHHCSTPLEHISFYPEPVDVVSSRLANGDHGDNTSTPRFFCHIDFHTLFSPHCRSCKTPIETPQIVTACGGHTYHPEHFWCAECGDPFGSDSVFVEDGGYPYCLTCAGKRKARRCRGCGERIVVPPAAMTDRTAECDAQGADRADPDLSVEGFEIEALGASWHRQCLKCIDCDHPIFDSQHEDPHPNDNEDDQAQDGRFFVREIEVPLTEKEKRRGLFRDGTRKTEERAVCVGCEGRRLKGVVMD